MWQNKNAASPFILSGKAFFVSSNRVKCFEQSSNYIKSNRFINNKEI